MALLKTERSAERTHDDTVAWLKFIRDRNFTRREKWMLLAHFDDPAAVYSSSITVVEAILKRAYLHKPMPTYELLAEDVCWLSNPEHYFLTTSDESFPRELKEIDDPPLALFLKGNIGALNNPSVSIVGSRRPSAIGAEVTKRISIELSACHVAIVSGLAYGVDSIAHDAVLPSKGRCIGVMACGLDTIYPAKHRWLADKIIAEQGLLVSEYPLGIKPTRYTFPERNRIVSGLGDGVLIVEAATNSGTMITAKFACDHGKPVMVVPGSAMSNQYAGSHALIQEGASLVCSAKEVIEVMSFEWAKDFVTIDNDVSDCPPHVDSTHSQILSVLRRSPAGLDSLKKNTSLTTAELSAMLLEMELLGYVARDPHGNFIATM